MPIHIEHLYKVLGKQEVLHDICLDIEDGEVVGLLGPNGAGKSTLMKIILGLWTPTSGNVIAPKTHGYLPELNPLYDYMYVREYLEMMGRPTPTLPQREGGKADGRRGREVQEMMERVGLKEVADKKIGELSKGYRQRVGIAQALLGNPELVILDEPTTGLDPNQVVEIRKVIGGEGGLRNEEIGNITILSTHRLEDVEKVCSRVIILDQGRIKYDSGPTPALPHREGGLRIEERGLRNEERGLRNEERGNRSLEEIFREVTNYGK